jgi:hypothetical protein
VVAGVGVCEFREFAVVPREIPAVDDEAADGLAMATDVLGCRVDDDVRPVLQRLHQCRRGGGVVDDEGDAGGLGDAAQRLQVSHVQPRVTQGLCVQRACPGADGSLHRVVFPNFDEFCPNAEPGEGHLEEVVGAAVEAACRDNLVSGLEQGEQRERLRRLPTGHCQSRDAALERRDALLEHVVGGVHDAAVDVAELLQGEKGGRMVRIAEAVTGGLVDGDCPRAGGGVELEAGVQGQRLGAVVRLFFF